MSRLRLITRGRALQRAGYTEPDASPVSLPPTALLRESQRLRPPAPELWNKGLAVKSRTAQDKRPVEASQSEICGYPSAPRDLDKRIRYITPKECGKFKEGLCAENTLSTTRLGLN